MFIVAYKVIFVNIKKYALIKYCLFLTINFEYSIIKNIGEWLNGRVVVSKTIGCVFESRLPCQNKFKPFDKVYFFIIVYNYCFTILHN